MSVNAGFKNFHKISAQISHSPGHYAAGWAIKTGLVGAYPFRRFVQ
jgi:hypothetical protein